MILLLFNALIPSLFMEKPPQNLNSLINYILTDLPGFTKKAKLVSSTNF